MAIRGTGKGLTTVHTPDRLPPRQRLLDVVDLSGAAFRGPDLLPVPDAGFFTADGPETLEPGCVEPDATRRECVP